jgi:hypothetical protein
MVEIMRLTGEGETTLLLGGWCWWVVGVLVSSSSVPAGVATALELAVAAMARQALTEPSEGMASS